MSVNEILNEKPVKYLKNPTKTVVIDLNKFQKLLAETYMSGFYDKGWGVEESQAELTSESLSAEKAIKVCSITP